MSVNKIIPFPVDRGLYSAKAFSADVGTSRFEISGTLCGCIDMAVPGGPTFNMTPHEAWSLARAILASRQDVLEGGHPDSDPRLIDQTEKT